MKASVWMRLICSAVAAGLPLSLLAFHDAGGPDAGHTAAPGETPLSCATAMCHTNSPDGGPINPTGFGGSATATFSQGSTYTPGTPITITVNVAEPNQRLFGFQMTARLESDPANQVAGRFGFQSSAGLGVLCADGDVGTPRSPNGNCPGIEFIEHNKAAQNGTWTFTWTPPTTDMGPVGFYLAGNAANGNGDPDGGDHIYTAKYVLNPPAPCTSSAPTIDHVISAGSFGARTDFAPGSWLEIYGANMGGDLKLWQGSDFSGSNAPTSLDGVSVKINGKNAYTWVVSAGQVNAQAPDNAGEGPLGLTVTNCAATSAPISVTQLRAAPGMWAPPTFTSNGKQLLGATTPDGLTFIGNIAGLQSRPAKPRETLIAYGIGFGATTPAIAPGVIAGSANQTAEPFQMTIGGAPAPTTYAGLAPGFVGLYQFNFIVPDVPDGDQPVVIKLGDTALPQTLFLTIQH